MATLLRHDDVISCLFWFIFGADDRMGKVRSKFTVEQKNIVLNLTSEDFSHAEIGRYVGVSRSCATRFRKCFES